MNKEQILNNIENIEANDLFEFIRQGIVTLDDLQKTLRLDKNKRKIIQELLDEQIKNDDNAWENSRYGNEVALSDYITNYPTGRHVQEAKEKMQLLEKQRSERQAKKQFILDNIRNNPNSYTPGMIKEYISNGTISRDDLRNCGIPDDIIDKLNNVITPTLNLGRTPDSIPDGYTEVYFWGIPGSGKTCALAAILSTAEKMGYLEIANGPGYDYMTRLKNIFVNQHGFLPSPSPVDTTQYLPFILRNNNDNPRSVSLIELSGEIFQCFYYKNADLPFQTENHQQTFNNLMNFLNDKNRKIHFFFIDYEKENEQDALGYTQADYLQAAAIFFNNNDIFANSTDAIYLVLTKSDLMDCNEEDKFRYSRDYLRQNFTAFINSLKARCKQHNINGGRLTVEPFSLGKVYFQQICSFDRTDSERIINILIDRIQPNRRSILDFFNK